MAIIWPCPLSPSSYAEAGREVAVPAHACPGCGRPLTGWGGYWRWLRTDGGQEQRLWIRRGRCPGCQRSHALLPSFLLVRRLDAVQQIGAGVEQAVAGSGGRTIAQRLDLPHTTVRDWWRRFRARAPTLLGALLRLATSLDPAPVRLRTEGAAAVLEGLASTWERAQQRLGTRLPDRWSCFSLISGGEALAAHTSPPFPAAPSGR
jgi:hypothetical protein